MNRDLSAVALIAGYREEQAIGRRRRFDTGLCEQGIGQRWSGGFQGTIVSNGGIAAGISLYFRLNLRNHCGQS